MLSLRFLRLVRLCGSRGLRVLTALKPSAAFTEASRQQGAPWCPQKWEEQQRSKFKDRGEGGPPPVYSPCSRPRALVTAPGDQGGVWSVGCGAPRAWSVERVRGKPGRLLPSLLTNTVGGLCLHTLSLSPSLLPSSSPPFICTFPCPVSLTRDSMRYLLGRQKDDASTPAQPAVPRA